MFVSILANLETLMMSICHTTKLQISDVHSASSRSTPRMQFSMPCPTANRPLEAVKSQSREQPQRMMIGAVAAEDSEAAVADMEAVAEDMEAVVPEDVEVEEDMVVAREVTEEETATETAEVEVAEDMAEAAEDMAEAAEEVVQEVVKDGEDIKEKVLHRQWGRGFPQSWEIVGRTEKSL